uniref:Uncharacterized protein n=1 Tax=Chromera velia CCMP2878 TaxID=1169474 RepID=A0A0G4FM50_9ALVE|eukprot:Cvel_17701.t1-p1 / transcript=Cvel_17701.t1 / gene=Cvel_17701 / organism=Chromera_velia_CCMP2878 / gene_product=hypothetical protein / transcript_product=hypothetical protein / location=Cvel_scaffold1429:13-590(+) / protein_length=98 / sequence_SO=supercontig / SO=protein_coding / is_pseudo=false
MSPSFSVSAGAGCMSSTSSPVSYSCPDGSSPAGGMCSTTTYSTVQSCPAGYTDTGAGCMTSSTIPATAETTYVAAAAPAKSHAAPLLSKSHGHGHHND